MTEKKIVKNLVLHQEGKHLPDGLYQQLADEIGSVIDQEIDEVVEKLMEDPMDIVLVFSRTCGERTREHMARCTLHHIDSYCIARGCDYTVLLPFTSADGHRFLPEEN